MTKYDKVEHGEKSRNSRNSDRGDLPFSSQHPMKNVLRLKVDCCPIPGCDTVGLSKSTTEQLGYINGTL